MTATGPGATWIRRANDREIGNTEFRCVTMIISGSRGGRSLEIRTLRHIEGTRCRTLFCVMEPRTFRGVSYVAEEVRGTLAMDVVLYLPYVVGTTRRIPPERCGDTFLGSELSYDDMRTWLPETGFHYDAPLIQEREVRIRGRHVGGAGPWRHGDLPYVVTLDRDTAFVTGIAYLDEADAVIREMRIPARTAVQGYELPAEIEMTTRSSSTSLFLQRARYDLDVDPVVFAPEHVARRRAIVAEL